MRRFFSVFLIGIFLAGIVGCASLPKKFIRKKKEPKHVPTAIYLEEGDTQKKYSNEYYYKTHFAYWQTWHSEFIGQLGGNASKVSRCAQESLSNLVEMKRYRKPEKQAALDEQIRVLSDITRKVESGYYTKSSQSALRSDLERIQRAVNNNFYFNKVKDDLIGETVDL